MAEMKLDRADMEMDPLDIVESVNRNILFGLREKHDAMAFQAFETYGYSKEWLMDQVGGDRVNVVSDPYGLVEIFYVDNEPLFKIVQKTTFDDINYVYRLEATVELIKEVK